MLIIFSFSVFSVSFHINDKPTPSWTSLERQSAGNQPLFAGLKLLINSPHRIRGFPEFVVCLTPTSDPYNRGNCHLNMYRNSLSTLPDSAL